MAGCGDINQSAVLDGCPSDTEEILFFNVQSQVSKMALRKWGDVKGCTGGAGGKAPYRGLVDGGIVGVDPVSGTNTFICDKFIGLGNNTNGRVDFVMDGLTIYNYGGSPTFTLNPTNGQFTLIAGLLQPGGTLSTDLNQ